MGPLMFVVFCGPGCGFSLLYLTLVDIFFYPVLKIGEVMRHIAALAEGKDPQ